MQSVASDNNAAASPALAIVAGLLACAAVVALSLGAANLVASDLGPLGIGAPLVWLVWVRPELAVVGMVGLLAGMLPLSSLYLPLVTGGVFAYDVILLGSLGLFSIRAMARDGLWIDWWPVTKPMLVFLALAAASVVYAVGFQDVELARSLNEFRPFVYFGASIVVALALAGQSNRTILLIGLFVVADIVSAALVVQQFLGSRQFVFPGMLSWQVSEVGAGGVTDSGESLGGGFGLVRIVPPANLLMFTMLNLALIWTLVPGLRRNARMMCAAQCALLGIGLLLTYTRAQWLASVTVIIMFVLLGPRVLRIHLAYGLVALFVLGASLFVIFQSGIQLPGAVQPAAEAMVGRAASILTPDATLNSASLQWRAFESEEALNSLAESPWGVGLGNVYRPITTYAGEAAGYQGPPLNSFMHNSFMYVAVKTGLQGFVAFIWFCLAFLINGWKLFRNTPDGTDRWLVLALLASFAGIMQWSVTEPNFINPGGTIAIGVIVGLLASLTRPIGDSAEQVPA